MPHTVATRHVSRFQQLLCLTLLSCAALVFSNRYAYAYSDVKFGYAACGVLLILVWLWRAVMERVRVGRAGFYFLLLALSMLVAAAVSRTYAINSYEHSKGLVFLAGCIGFGLVTAFSSYRNRMAGKLAFFAAITTTFAYAEAFVGARSIER